MSADRPNRRTVLKRRARSVLVWGAVAFVLGQAALFAGLEGRLAHWRDPESAIKLARLRERLRERGGADLVLALGTSRVSMGIRPDCIHQELARTPALPSPMVFNYGVNNGGPLLDLVYLRRALRAGVRPRVVLVELWPISLKMAGPVAVHADRDFYLHRSGVADIEEVSRHAARPLDFLGEWAGNQLTLCHSQRSTILAMAARKWLPRDTKVDMRWRGIDAWGFQYLPGHGTHDAERFRSNLPRWRAAFAEYYAGFRVSPAADAALREILGTCRKEGIRAVLLRMPESPSLRSWMTPNVTAEMDLLLARLKQDYGVSAVDTRDWMGEGEFSDPVHLTPDGAAEFSRRFAREVLSPVTTASAPGR